MAPDWIYSCEQTWERILFRALMLKMQKMNIAAKKIPFFLWMVYMTKNINLQFLVCGALRMIGSNILKWGIM